MRASVRARLLALPGPSVRRDPPTGGAFLGETSEHDAGDLEQSLEVLGVGVAGEQGHAPREALGGAGLGASKRRSSAGSTPKARPSFASVSTVGTCSARSILLALSHGPSSHRRQGG